MSVLDFLNPARLHQRLCFGRRQDVQRRRPIIPSPVAGSLAVLDQTTKSAVEVGAGAASSRPKPWAHGDEPAMKASLWADSSTTSWAYLASEHRQSNPRLLRWCTRARHRQPHFVKEGAALSGTKTDLNANDELDGVTIAASAGYNTGTLSASGMRPSRRQCKNRIAIDDEARIEARSDDLTIKALRDDSVQTVAGALSFVKSVDGAANARRGGRRSESRVFRQYARNEGP